MAIIPRYFFLTKGVGVHEKELRAFEEALRDAGAASAVSRRAGQAGSGASGPRADEFVLDGEHINAKGHADR